jgi:hypothetical protein
MKFTLHMSSPSKDPNNKAKTMCAMNSAPPPVHSVVALAIATAVCIKNLPSAESLDEVATMETFTNVVFPDLLGVYSLAFIRLAIAISIWFTILELAIFSNGWTQMTFYLTGSKLKQMPTRMKDIKTLGPFTCWSWIMLGISFTLNAYISIMGAAATATATSQSVNPWLLRVALCIWEISAPCTLLVSAVVRYAIWPIVLAAPNGDTSNLKNHRNMMMHNMNSIFAITELAITGGLPIRLSEMGLLPLYGIVYVIFTWSMTMSWNEPSAGPQFLYFFFDTTLPGLAPTLLLTTLLAVLLVSFGIFYACKHLLASIGGGSLFAHLVFCVFICSSVMRFRD